MHPACRALLADSQQALLDGIPLGFGERATFGEPVDGLQRGVNQLGVVLRAGKEGGTAGQQGQQGRADVPVHGQRRLSGAQSLLWAEEQGTRDGYESKTTDTDTEFGLRRKETSYFSFTDRVQRCRGSEVRQEANLQHVEQEGLVLNTVHTFQEEHHGSLMVRTETCRHVRLCHGAI